MIQVIKIVIAAQENINFFALGVCSYTENTRHIVLFNGHFIATAGNYSIIGS